MHTLHTKTLLIATALIFSLVTFAAPLGTHAQVISDHALAGAYYNLAYAKETPQWINDTQDVRAIYPERAPLKGYDMVGSTQFIKEEIQTAKSAKMKYFIFPLTLNASGIVEQDALSRMKTLLATEQFFFIPQFETNNILLFPEQWKNAVTALSNETAIFKSTTIGSPVYISYDFNTVTPEAKAQLTTLVQSSSLSQVNFYAVSDLYKESASTTSITGLSGTALTNAINTLIQQSALFPCDKDVYTAAFDDIKNAVYGSNLNALTHCSATPGGGSNENRLFSSLYTAQYKRMKPVISQRANMLTSIGFKGVLGDKYLPQATQSSSWAYYETYQETALRVWNSVLKLKPSIPVYPSLIVAHDRFYMDNALNPTILAGSPTLYDSLLETSEAIFGKVYPEGYLITAGDWNSYETGNIILPTKIYGNSYVNLLKTHLQ